MGKCLLWLIVLFFVFLTVVGFIAVNKSFNEAQSRIEVLETRIAELENVVLINDMLLYQVLGPFCELSGDASAMANLEKYYAKRKPEWEKIRGFLND